MVVEPWGAHPSYAQGYYDRDNEFYVAWEAISRDPARAAEGYLETSPSLRRLRRTGAEYMGERQPGLDRQRLTGEAMSGRAPEVNYGLSADR